MPERAVKQDADRDAEVEALYRELGLPMIRLARLLVDDRETAEDVMQDAFAVLYRRWDALRDIEAASAYLRTAVVNGSRSVLRRRRTVRQFGRRPDDALSSPPADLNLLIADDHLQVLAALRTLPARQREVLVLRYWSELTEPQVAATLGISIGAVKSTASRGRAALAAILEGNR